MALTYEHVVVDHRTLDGQVAAVDDVGRFEQTLLVLLMLVLLLLLLLLLLLVAVVLLLLGSRLAQQRRCYCVCKCYF